MFDDRLEDRLRSALRQTGDELSLTVTPAELERRLTVRRRARTAQRSTLLAAAVGIIAVGAIVGSAPSWLPQTPNQIAATASPSATVPPASPTAVAQSPSPLPSPSAESPATPSITTLRYREWTGKAYDIAFDGTGRRRVPAFDIEPDAGVPGFPRDTSPDGRFKASAVGDTVTIAQADGGGSSDVIVPRLKANANTDFDWSPDGRFIAVWRHDSFSMIAPRYLWMVDVARQVTTMGPLKSFGSPSSAWSPDSQSLAFGVRDGLKVVTAGTGELRVYQKPGNDIGGYIGLAWSPDGRWITFIPFEAGNGEVHRINADTTGHLKLGAGTDGFWAPDGSRIAYTRRSDGPAGRGTVFEIWTMAPDGSDQRVLASKPCPCGSPTWSPDGTWISFIALHGTLDEVWIVRADGGAARRLAKNAYFVEWVSP
jgi:WD40 repeat protein